MFDPSSNHASDAPAYSRHGPVPTDSTLHAHFQRMRQLRPGLHLHADDARDMHDLTAQGEMSEGLRIVVLLEGAVDVSYGARNMRLATRDGGACAALISVAEPDGFGRRARGGGYARRVSLGLGAPWLDQAAGEGASSAIADFMREHLSVHQWRVSPRIAAVAEQIVRPPQFEPLMQHLYLESRALEIVSDALAAVPGAAPGMAVPAQLRPQEHRRMRELRDYLAHCEDDDISLDSLARQACTNANTLQKQFRALYGMTVFEFVRESRLQRARQALESDGVTVGQAAICAGYSSAANFSTAYRRRFGISPKLARSRV